ALRRKRGDAVSLHRLEPASGRPKPYAHDEQRREEADQEDDDEQNGQFDVRLDIAPQVERRVGPITAGEQGQHHRYQDPEQGLQELHGGPFRRAARSWPAFATFVALASRFVASSLNKALRARSPT